MTERVARLVERRPKTFSAFVSSAALLLAFLLTLTLVPAYAGDGDRVVVGRRGQSIGYILDATITPYRENLSGADPVDASSQLAGLTGSDAFETGGVNNFGVHGRFSNAGANARVVVVYGFEHPVSNVYTFQTVSVELTLVAGTITEGTNFTSPEAFFDTGGVNRLEVRIVSVSAGTLDLWARSW